MKRLLSFLPTHFTLCLIVGIVLQFQYKLWTQNVAFFTVFLFFIFTILFFFKRLKKARLFTLLSWFLFVFVGMYVVVNQDVVVKKKYYNKYNPSQYIVTFKASKILKSNIYYDKIIGEVVKVGSVNTVGKVMVNIQKDSLKSAFKIDDLLFFRTDFFEIPSPKNPHQFDYKAYLKKQGVLHQVFLKIKGYKHQESSQNSIYKIAEKIRNRVEEKLILNGFKGEELGVIKALVLGQRNNVSKELLQEYTKAGAIHILAVSGLHVGIILLILSWLLKPIERIRFGKLIKMLFIVILLWFFAVIAGFSASVVRAVTMFSAVAIGMAFGRKTFVIHSLITSMFILLLIKPLFVFDVGFQLSYLAVFSIVTIQPKLVGLWSPKWKVLDKFWQLFTVSIAAQIGVLPISLFYFHQFPGLFMLSNLVIIPFIGFILIAGILVITLALLNILPDFVAAIYNWIIGAMNNFVGWISIQEAFLITEISFSSLLLVSSYVCVFLGIYLLDGNTFKKWMYFLVAILFLQICLVIEKAKVITKNELIVFNKSRQTIIGENRGGLLTVYHNLDTLLIKKTNIIKDYKIGEQLVGVNYKNHIPNLFEYKLRTILVVDSLGVYKVKGLKNPIVLLRSSPKINLERLIQVLEPSQIIADASNYKSQVLDWKLMSDKKKIPFFYTQEEGAFILK